MQTVLQQRYDRSVSRETKKIILPTLNRYQMSKSSANQWRTKED